MANVTAKTSYPGGMMSTITGANYNASGVLAKGNKAFQQRFKRLCRDATKAFIETTVDHIMVDTGMSAASLQPLAAQVGLKKALAASLRGSGPKRRRTEPYGAFTDNGMIKSVAQGQRLGAKSYTYTFSGPGEMRFVLEFDIPVLQWYLHEFGYAVDMNSGAPQPAWNALDYGAQAFEAYVSKNWVNVMKPRDMLRWVTTGVVDNA